jgi:signal transduction histidine kinase
MGVISTMLVSLIIIQVLWLLGAAKAEKREKHLRVSTALNKVREQLKDNSLCFESFAKSYVDVGERFYMLHVQKNGQTDTVVIYYDEALTRDKKVGVLNSMKLGLPFSMDIQLRAYVTAEDSSRFLSRKNAFYEDLKGGTLREIIRNKQPIDSMFSLAVIDSLIGASLEHEKADTSFGFGLIDLENNKIACQLRIKDSMALRSSPHYLALFTDNRFMTPYKLAIVFPASNSLFSINYLLILSVLVILLLTFSFYAFVSMYLKQDQLSKMKSDFIHNLTHEFNTPMANIALALETLDGPNKIFDENTKKVINIISVESARLQENIERSLQIAVMDEGGLLLHKEEIDIVELLNTVVNAYALQCETLGGNITFSCASSPVVFADETHLLNCVVNLLDNAIKYRNGAPVINISVEQKANTIVITITDNGIGMDNETQKHIFDKFYRAHEGDTHNTKGFGLGLSYVKGIVTKHGGTIEVWSKKAVGSKFVITLPITDVTDGKN